MIGLPNYVLGVSASISTLVVSLGVFWIFLLLVALALAAANGRDPENGAFREAGGADGGRGGSFGEHS